MFDVRRLCRCILVMVAIGLTQSIVAANPPNLAVVSAKPRLTGGHDLVTLTPSLQEVTVLGSQIALNASSGMGGVLLESGIAGLTFTDLQLTSTSLPSFTVTPILGDNDSGLFTRAWTATPIPNGVNLSWQPGAPMLGQGVADPNAPGGVAYYSLLFELDPTANPGIDLNAFDA